MLDSQTEQRYSRLTKIPKAQIFPWILQRKRIWGGHLYRKREFLIPQEMCGGLHTPSPKIGVIHPDWNAQELPDWQNA